MIAALAVASSLLQADVQSRLLYFAKTSTQVERLPSLSLSIVTKDQVFSAAWGSRVWGGGRNVTASDMYHHGSLTKAVTAVVIATLVDQGKLKWTMTMGEAFPDLKTIDPRLKEVTLAQLLRHRSGLAGNYPMKQGAWFDTKLKETDIRKEFTEACLSEAPKYDPGTRNEYSNKNYVIAGALIEKVTGKSYEQVVRERIFGTLNMRSAGFGPVGKEGDKTQPWGHTWKDNTWNPVRNDYRADNPPVMASAGRMHSSVADLGKFVQAVLNKDSIVSQSSWTQLLTVGPEGDHAMGWMIAGRQWAKGDAYTHAGSNTMNYTLVWIAPNWGYAFIASTNAYSSDVPAKMDKVISEMISYVYSLQ